MKQLLKYVSLLGLLLTVVPSFLVFTGTIDMGMHKTLMLLGTFLWFIPAPFWIKKSE
jgi:hypothetical protein